MAEAPRYALYFVPRAETDLARFGAGWLGWEIEAARNVEHAETLGLPLSLHAPVTAEPRRYGFHATLKAPFRLTAGRTESELVAATADFAAQYGPVSTAGLKAGPLAGFLALTQREWSPAMHDLAAEAMAQLDSFRAPLTEAERMRRNRGTLSAAQRALLERWGYPYVMGEFRFHMTLTGALDSETSARVGDVLIPRAESLARESLAISDVALCVEPASSARFRVLRRFALGG